MAGWTLPSRAWATESEIVDLAGAALSLARRFGWVLPTQVRIPDRDGAPSTAAVSAGRLGY